MRIKRYINKVNRFNLWLMTGLANANATAWTFYILVFSVIKVWTIQTPHTPLEWLTQIVQTLYQGSALPLIAYVSKSEGRFTRRILTEMHDVEMKEFSEIKKMHSEMKCKVCDGQPDK